MKNLRMIKQSPALTKSSENPLHDNLNHAAPILDSKEYSILPSIMPKLRKLNFQI